MIKREGQIIQIFLGPSVSQDRVNVSVRIVDDAEDTNVSRAKDLNVGAQGEALLAPFVDWALGKMSTPERPVTRPT